MKSDAEVEISVRKAWVDVINSQIEWCKSVERQLKVFVEAPDALSIFSSKKLMEINMMQRKLSDVSVKLNEQIQLINEVNFQLLTTWDVKEQLCDEIDIIQKASVLCEHRMAKVPSPDFGIICSLLMPYTAITYHINMFIKKIQISKLKKQHEELKKELEK